MSDRDTYHAWAARVIRRDALRAGLVAALILVSLGLLQRKPSFDAVAALSTRAGLGMSKKTAGHWGVAIYREGQALTYLPTTGESSWVGIASIKVDCAQYEHVGLIGRTTGSSSAALALRLAFTLSSVQALNERDLPELERFVRQQGVVVELDPNWSTQEVARLQVAPGKLRFHGPSFVHERVSISWWHLLRRSYPNHMTASVVLLSGTVVLVVWPRSLRVVVHHRRGQCPRCGYAGQVGVCPECGLVGAFGGGQIEGSPGS